MRVVGVTVVSVDDVLGNELFVVEDFQEVFSFQEAFDEPFYIGTENDDPEIPEDDDAEF